MPKIVGVRFKNAGKLYYFDPGSLWPTPGDMVLVETTRGYEYAEVILGVSEAGEEQIQPPLKPVLRIATEEDAKQHAKNKAMEQVARPICLKKIQDHQLDMKLVGVEYTFDQSKLIIYFTANGRVDFRALVKDLAAQFKTRIELKQIGVRDEAKMLGGLGPCGRPLCCSHFLGDFQPVSIKMAKEQNLSLNPTKISGICGRLMCCLKYEESFYEQTRKRMPRVGKPVITPMGEGTVQDINILKETVKVRIDGSADTAETVDFPLADIQKIPVRHEGKQHPAPAATAPQEDVLPDEIDLDDGDLDSSEDDPLTE